MKGPGPSGPVWLRKGLLGISQAYAVGIRLRSLFYDHRVFTVKQLPCVVISVGNVTVGGTGKTPMTIYLAEMLTHAGFRIVVLSRGYGGRAENTGGMVSDGQQILMTADDCGDEPYMMARRLETVPVVVGKDRFRSGMMAVRRFRPHVILLDDAFQHRRLARDLDLVLLDAAHPFGNGHLLPRGILREPRTSLGRGHAVVFTRTPETGLPLAGDLRRLIQSKPVFYADHRPKIVHIISADSQRNTEAAKLSLDKDLSFLKGRQALAFSGIARNQDFFEILKAAACQLVDEAGFPDHHRYARNDIRQIQRSAQNRHADCLVTTEKDYRRMPPGVHWERDLVVVGVDMTFNDKAFDRFIMDKVASQIQKAGMTENSSHGSEKRDG